MNIASAVCSILCCSLVSCSDNPKPEPVVYQDAYYVGAVQDAMIGCATLVKKEFKEESPNVKDILYTECLISLGATL